VVNYLQLLSLRFFDYFYFLRIDYFHAIQEPGIAYRGRVLMELNAHMGEADPGQKDKANIPETESNDVMVSQLRKCRNLLDGFWC
jgi:hypothetical protein